MRRVTILIALVTLLSLPTFSQTSKVKKLQELFAVMQTDKTIDATFERIVGSFMQQVKAGGDEATEDEKQQSQQQLEQIMELSKQTVKRMTDDMLEVYERYYTEEEVEKLIEFYQSPIGQKTIRIQPELTEEMMRLMTTKHMPELQQKIEAHAGK